jgi:hypothetical protein
MGRWRDVSEEQQQMQYERYSQATTPNNSKAVAGLRQVQFPAVYRGLR